MLEQGCGITNIVDRATNAADALTSEELVAGGESLAGKVRRYEPPVLAIVGIGAYRTAFGRPRAVMGLQTETIGETAIWMLPNPSGLNAHYRPEDFVRLFGELRSWIAKEER